MRDQLLIAAEKLSQGEIICFPTETLYALACNACEDEAVNKIYALKSRTKNNPLSVMTYNIPQAQKLGIFGKEALNIANNFWPGPLTIIVKRQENSLLSNNINNNAATIGIRIPNHPIALKLLQSVNFPLIATSANKSGYPPATSKKEIENYFNNESIFILDDIVNSPYNYKNASTIIDATNDNNITIIRQGILNLSKLNL